jgi:hypothetical protein
MDVISQLRFTSLTTKPTKAPGLSGFIGGFYSLHSSHVQIFPITCQTNIGKRRTKCQRDVMWPTGSRCALSCFRRFAAMERPLPHAQHHPQLECRGMEQTLRLVSFLRHKNIAAAGKMFTLTKASFIGPLKASGKRVTRENQPMLHAAVSPDMGMTTRRVAAH